MIKQPMQLITLTGYIFLPVVFMGIFIRDSGWANGLIGVLVNSIAISGIFISQDYVYNRVYFRIQDFLVASPTKSWEYVLGIMLSTYIPMIPSILLSLILLYLSGVITDLITISLTLLILLYGSIGFSFLGFLLGTLTNNPTTVSGLSNILGLILGFLAPVYYPLEYLPESIRIYTLILPSTPIPEILRILYGLSNIHMLNLYSLLGLTTLWNVLFVSLSIKVAYWREK